MLSYTAFDGFDILSQGPLDQVAADAHQRLRTRPGAAISIFSDASGQRMDLELRGSEKEVRERLRMYRSAEPEPEPSQPGPGRPRLGVVAREVSLLPAHWEWLSNQGGGASATLRRLVDERMRASPSAKERQRQAQERAYKALHALAGDLPKFEEAIRFLYRKDRAKFRELVADWPGDLPAYALRLAREAFPEEDA